MKTFLVRTTEVIISQCQFAVQAETEEDARRILFNSKEGGTKLNYEMPEERRIYFDEEVAPGLRDLAQHWEEHLKIEEDYDGPC
jgi:hypothetical protein